MSVFGVSRLSQPVEPFPLMLLDPHCSGISFALGLSILVCPDFRTGGDDGVRTHDPLLAGQVLSQLSYTPIFGVILLSE